MPDKVVCRLCQPDEEIDGNIFDHLRVMHPGWGEGGTPVTDITAPFEYQAYQQRPYVASTEQVWALHDAMPQHLRAAVLLGAFAGLRTAEACGLRPGDVDFLRGIITPALQYPAEPLKTACSQFPLPVPREFTLALSAHIAQWPGMTVLTDGSGSQLGPWVLERAIRAARATVRACSSCGLAQHSPTARFCCRSCDKSRSSAGLPAGFRFHDLRHYYASLLIASGEDIKTVQARLRHKSARTTLDTYGHLWPDRDGSTREAVAAAFRGPLADRSGSGMINEQARRPV